MQLFTQALLVHVWLLEQVPQLIIPPQPSEMDPQVDPEGQALSGVQPPVHVSFDEQVAPPVHAVVSPEVHCSQAPASEPEVSHTGVPPPQAPPLSVHAHMRHPVVVVPEHTALTGPLVTHAF